MKIIKPILYFSYFKYPITKKEIIAFSQVNESEKEINKQLEFLQTKKVIFKFGDYYATENEESWVKRRLEGNEMASKVLPKAIRRAQFIGKFPFVKSVSLSGSLSKGYFDDEGDFDFFIITKSNRLWIARTCLILFKKIFLLNNKKYFCINYLISESNLSIEEKNRFTATELVTLIPVVGEKLFLKFLQNNEWANAYYPNKKKRDLPKTYKAKKGMVSGGIQLLFTPFWGSYCDEFLRKITLKKWSASFKSKMSSKDFNIAMKSTKDTSKHHPRNYQNKVIKKLNQLYDELNEVHQLELKREHA